MPRNESIEDLLAKYRANAVGAATLEAKTNHKCTRILLRCRKQLRQTELGRQGISQLMSDENPHVRVWAAAHSLEWNPELARPVLEALRDSDGPGSFDAKWTLIEFDKGKMRFDY